MIGQTKLLQKLNNYTIDTFPRSLLLVGEEGSGKHLVCDYIKENILKLPLLDITTNLSAEYIDQIYRNPNPNIYLIDLSNIAEKEQNVILKFIEEPLNNSFIIMLTEDLVNVLNTVSNRCFKLGLENYSKAELLEFVKQKNLEIADELVFDIIKTPGQLLSCDPKSIPQMLELVRKMLEKMNIATYSNTLSICGKLNFKNEYDKFDYNIFLNLLIREILNYYNNTADSKYYKLYFIVLEHQKKLIDKRLNKEYLFQHLLSEMWQFCRK